MKYIQLSVIALTLAVGAPSAMAAFCSARCHIESNNFSVDDLAHGQGGTIEQAYEYLVADCNREAGQRAAEYKTEVNHYLITRYDSATGGRKGFWGSDLNSSSFGFDVRAACISGNGGN